MPRAFQTCVTLLLIATLAGLAPAWADPGVCPRCGAPTEPGAAFCVRCGAKLSSAVPAVPPPEIPSGIVQVLAVHDSELTSTFGSLVYGSGLSVSSVLGTAFCISPGQFVTDAGLLTGAKEVSLVTATGRSVPARVLGVDAMIGVALLGADLPGASPLALREGELPDAGEGLRAIGFPSGAGVARTPVSSSGVLSGRHRGGARIHPIEDYLQSDASLPRGLAGGPMIDARGRAVGMSTGFVFGSRVLLGPETGIGYSIPAPWIARAIDWVRSGSPERGWLGIYPVPANAERRARHRLPDQASVIVDQVFPGSPASAAGLRRGDGILKLDGEGASTLPQLQERLLFVPPGQTVRLEVARGSDIQAVAVTLSPRPGTLRLSGLDAVRYFGEVELAARGGDGLIVVSVAPGSLAAHLKIAAGDTLQSVLSKKDWDHGAKDSNSRWRSVRNAEDLEARLATAYSDLDFFVGLRFRTTGRAKVDLFLWEIVSEAPAL